MMTKRAFLAAMLVAGCASAEGETSEEQRNVGLSEQAQPCAELTLDACAQNLDCRVISGVAIDATQQCLGAREDLGCVAADLGCDDAHTAALDAAGNAWWLNDSCLPSGFTVRGGTNAASYPRCGEGEPVTTSCETKSAAACKLDDRCRVTGGLLVDRDRECLGALVELGCETAEERACDQAHGIAVDSSGQPYWFGNLCIPAGLTYLSPTTGTPQTEWADYPRCGDEQPATTPCETKTVAACKLDDRCRVTGGSLVDRDRECLGALVELGCETAEERACDQAYGIAVDASGQPYWFGALCIPAGLTYLSPTTGTPQVEWANYPHCEGM